MKAAKSRRTAEKSVVVCQKCGDIGFAELLIFCKQCRFIAEHRYCLDQLPDPDDHDVIWSCETCVPKVVKEVDNRPTRKSERITSRRVHSEVNERLKKNKYRNGSVAEEEISIQEPLEPHKTDLPHGPAQTLADFSLHEDNCLNLSNEDINVVRKLKKQRRRLILEEGEIYDDDDDDGDENVKQQQVNSDFGDAPESLQQVNTDSGDAPKRLQQVNADFGDIPPIFNAPNYTLKANTDVSDSPKKNADIGDILKSMKRVKYVVGDSLKGVPQVSTDNGAASKSMHEVSAGVSNTQKCILPGYTHALPVRDPVWSGCFEMSDNKPGRMVAHLSNKACLKVWEGAHALSPLLSVEMLSRFDAWPNSFTRSAPTDDNIALYFFPESDSESRLFDELVNEMIDLDLALRAVLDNAELLIYPSDQLPQPLWRFGGRHYLWGVFKGRKDSGPSKPVPHPISDQSTECTSKAKDPSNKCWNVTSPLSTLSSSGSYPSGSPRSPFHPKLR